MSAPARILFVDDDPHLLHSYQRQFRREFEITTAESGEAGLSALREQGPFAVVICDYQMPYMDGITFLGHARTLAPLAVRMMLTGQADLRVAMDAINKGSFFRFMIKPCPADLLRENILAAIEQHQLVTAEQRLLETTLKGSIRMLVETLQLASPLAFSRASRVTRLASKLAARLRFDKAWELECAVMLSQIGCLTISPEILEKKYRAERLNSEETAMFLKHPEVGRNLVTNIPRMEGVAEAIGHQETRFDGKGSPDGRSGEQIPFLGRLLKVVLDYDTYSDFIGGEALALQEMQKRDGWYDPEIFHALRAEVDPLIAGQEAEGEPQEIMVRDVELGMVVASDILTTDGMLLVPRGNEITPVLRMRLSNFADLRTVVQPIYVFAKAS